MTTASEPDAFEVRDAPRRHYSVGSVFAISFFAGPLGAVAISALNAHHLRRLLADAWIFVVAFLVAVAAIAAGAWTIAADANWLAAFELDSSHRAVRYGLRAVGVAICAALYWRYRRVLREDEEREPRPRPPWLAGVACVVGGWAAQASVVLLVSRAAH